MNHKANPCIRRRDFLKVAAAALAIHGCTRQNPQDLIAQLPHITPAQEKWRKTGRSIVGIVRCESYEENIAKNVKQYISQLNLPDLKNKTVVLKPNMVEFQPGHPIFTNPEMIRAAAEIVDHLGAKEIIVAEGPGHMRDTEFLLASSGIGPMCSKLGLPFIDLNLDDLEKLNNEDGFNGLNSFYLPKTIVHADAVVSLPKLKTHHWVGMTASMKNLFGTVPGRKYGWPKNVLHVRGIPNSIIDLVHLVRPSFAIVDAIVSMEGDGPIMGTAKNTGFVVLGTDLAAVDATCARTMDISLADLKYVRMAGKVIGNIDSDQIDIIGATLNSVKQPFIKPITLLNKALLTGSAQQSS
jgi:uncharacterized protein (DUF362 family)